MKRKILGGMAIFGIILVIAIPKIFSKKASELNDSELSSCWQNDPKCLEIMQSKFIDSIEKYGIEGYHSSFKEVPLEVKKTWLSQSFFQKKLIQNAIEAASKGEIDDSASATKYVVPFLLLRNIEIHDQSAFVDYYKSVAKIEKIKFYQLGMGQLIDSACGSGSISIDQKEKLFNQLYSINDYAMVRDLNKTYLKSLSKVIRNFHLKKSDDRSLIYEIDLDAYASPTIGDYMDMSIMAVMNPMGSVIMREMPEIKKVSSYAYIQNPSN